MVTEPVTRPFEGPGDDTLPDAVKQLPKKAKEIWVAAFNNAFDNYDPETSEQDSQESHAFAIAWGAVNAKFKKNDDGEWVARSYLQGTFDAPFTQVKRADDGSVTWRSTISDDGVDRYASRMTTDLHDDFIVNAEARGMPFLTISHFNMLARIGRADHLWRDGRRLKADGRFFTDSEDPFIRELAEAAASSALAEMSVPPKQRAIRTSIGFKPTIGGIVQEDLGVIAYVRGFLGEITMTTHPGNSRVDFSSERRSGDMVKRISPEFMEEDAASIVGEELARALGERLSAFRGERSDEDAIDTIYRSFGGDLDMTGSSVRSHKGRTKETEKWDGDAATKRARVHSGVGSTKAEDRQWGTYRSFHAVYDPDNEETFGAYGFIHHDVDDDGMFVDLRGVLAAGAAAQGSRSGEENPEARTHLAPHYKQFDRTPPWERSLDDLGDRVQDLADLYQLEDLVGTEAVERAKSQFCQDVADGKLALEESDDVRITKADDLGTAGWTIRSKHGLFTMPPIPEKGTVERSGRRLAGKRLEQLSGAADQLAGVATAIRELVQWASESKDEEARSLTEALGKSRSLHGDPLAAGAGLLETLKTRFGDTEPDDSLIDNLEMQGMIDLVFKATFTLSDIIVANMEPDDDLSLEARMQNVQNAMDEFTQVVNQVLLGAFGGGRSTEADNRSVKTKQRSRPNVVNPDGDGPGAVNTRGKTKGKPDLQRFDGATETLRQVVLDDDATTEALQEALDELGASIEDTRPEEEVTQDAVVERVARLEMDVSQVAAGIEKLLQRGDEPLPETAPTRTYVPRRRSLPAGPTQETTPAERKSPQEGLSRRGQAKRYKIEEAIGITAQPLGYP